MVIDSWVRKRTYDTFREFVGSGMNYHLQVKLSDVANRSKNGVFKWLLKLNFLTTGKRFIRDVFELGPPMLIDSAALKAMKSSRLERVGQLFVFHMYLSFFIFAVYFRNYRFDCCVIISFCSFSTSTMQLRLKLEPRPGTSFGTKGWMLGSFKKFCKAHSFHLSFKSFDSLHS